MRNPNTVGGSRVLQVEEPTVNGRPGEILATRNWKGEPVSRSGTEGPDLVGLAMEQLAQDQAPPQTDYSAQDLPGGGTVYTKRPFEALTGRTNFTPYGTVSSRIPATPPETEEERVAREWNRLVTQGQPSEPIVQQAPVPGALEQAQLQGRLQRDAAMTPGTVSRDIWEEGEDARRAASGLGPVATAYEDFVADRDFSQQEADLSRDIYNSARRAERQTRTEQGRRNKSGELIPTRTSSISPQFAPVLREASRTLARQILSGGSPDAITQGWQNLTRGAVAGAPAPMTPEERYQQQQSRESAERLSIGKDQNKRSQTEFEQSQAERKDFQDSLLKWQGAQTEADRNRVIRESPALQKYFGVRVSPAEGVSRTDAEFAQQSLKDLSKRKNEDNWTPEERQQADTYKGMIAQYTQEQAKRMGIQPSQPKETPTYQTGKIYGGMRFKGGDPNDQNNWQKVR